MEQIKNMLQKELEGRGMYPAEGLWYGAPYAPVERLTTPITPRENLLRYYRGEDYLWIPDILSDQIDITPECNPDVKAQGFEGGYDAFGVKWIPVENADLPAFVEPGFILLEDIADWKTLKWPEPDEWNWAEDAERYNKTYERDDRLRRGIVYSGYFERLISIMGFEGAAMALLTDPESVTEFFDGLTELNKKIMDHYIQDFGCESIMLHDDWSAQRSPFFSLDTARELLVPHMKKVADYAHEKGVLFTLHSCGNGQALIPAIKETGVDAWQVQIDALDGPAVYEEAGDDFMIESYPLVPDGIRGEELERFIRSTLEAYTVRHKGLVEFYDMDPDRLAECRRTVYKVSRELAAEK